MVRYFAQHPTASNVLMVAIIAIGIFSLGMLKKESFPLLTPSKVQVNVTYPGATPEDVEDGICRPLEDATDGISFLEEQDCDARDNQAVFTLEMHDSGNIQTFLDDIRTAVDAIQKFPKNIEDPVITLLGRTNKVVSVAITSKNLSYSELKSLGEYYRDRLSQIPSIPIVSLTGFSTHQLQILIPPDNLKKFSLSIQSIASLISSQALELPLGTIESNEKLYQLQFDNIKKTTAELSDLVILNTDDGGEIKLSDIALIKDTFEYPEQRIVLNNQPAAVLQISKNSNDDMLKVADAVSRFVEHENSILPPGTQLTIINNHSTLVRDRLQLLINNGWQGLILATLVLQLFFSWRYSFWIALGLPVSFLGGLALMVIFGVSINMISMVALLVAIGILMDDAIVLSENIEKEFQNQKDPLKAAIAGTQKVFKGVFSSYLTSALLFGSLLLMKGDLGQILGVLPVVLLSVLTISLIEAFLILPHHLKQSLARPGTQKSKWKQQFDTHFSKIKTQASLLTRCSLKYRYLTIGIALALLISCIGLVATGTLKFQAFPDMEGNSLEARILLPQGTPLAKTENYVAKLLLALNKTNQTLSKNESESLVKNIQIKYGIHGDVPENGTHLATLNIDLLNTEKRHTTLSKFIQLWKNNTPRLPEVISIQYKEPKVGPAGRAIHIRLSGKNLDELASASVKLQNMLRAYPGVSNLVDDLRPGKPQFNVQLKPGALKANIDSQSIAYQLRTAYQGLIIDKIYHRREPYEIIVKLADTQDHALSDFENLTVFSKNGTPIPLTSVVTITEQRKYSRISRINHQRSVNIYADVDAKKANTQEIINSIKPFLTELNKQYPNVTIQIKGEIENGTETKQSIISGFAIGVIGIFLLLSLQFRNYWEPLLVMTNIPLALIGTILGHIIMGLDFTLPSMIGFVSLAGVVVNDSILLVESIKHQINQGKTLHSASEMAVQDRFRAIFLTSVTTIAGMTPLLFETSTQALILVPLVTSIVFGMLTSTLLILLILPALYAIMADLGLRYSK